MTAIAYRDGIMAADAACYRGSTIVGYRRKIGRFPDGICGFAGNSVDCFRMQQLFLAGGDMLAPLPDRADFSGLIVRRTGLGRIHISMIDGTFYEVPAPEAPFYAVGCYGEFLIGAMAAGASAEEAIRLAILHTDAAGEIQVESI